MKGTKDLRILGALTFLCFHSCDSLDSLEECRKTDDNHVTRGDFTCCSKSPRGLPLESSLDFRSNWQKCATEPESTNKDEDPVVSAWRVYRCLVFLGLRRKPLNPSTFATLMTTKYPALLKAQIGTRMAAYANDGKKIEVDIDCDTRVPYPKVHLLRNLFYDIEQEICEGDEYSPRNYSAVKSQPATPWIVSSVCEVCSRRQEMYHRNGDCCSQVAIPFPFIYLPYRYGNQERVEDCVKDAIDDVGLPPETQFANHLKYLCYPSCEHFLSGNLKDADFWNGPTLLQSQSELRAVVEKMTPRYFAPKYKLEMTRTVIANFRSAWKETKTFESRISPTEQDLRNSDKGKLKNLLASCRAHRLIETIMNLYLNGVCVEQYYIKEQKTTTTKKPVFTSDEYDTNTDDDDWGWDLRRRAQFKKSRSR